MDAPHAQGRDDPARRRQLPRAAAQVQPFPGGVQRRTAARGIGHAHARFLLRELTARDAKQAPAARVPDRFEVRYVSANGGIRWKKRAWVNVSSVCIGEYVGLEEIDDGVWDVYFGPLRLGRLHDRLMRIEDAYGRLRRHEPRKTNAA